MPSLENLYRHFNDNDFVLLAISVGETADTVRSFIQSRKYSFVNVLDENKEVGVMYGIRSHPMKFLVDKDGSLIGVHKGYREWDSEKMKSQIELLINSGE